MITSVAIAFVGFLKSLAETFYAVLIDVYTRATADEGLKEFFAMVKNCMSTFRKI